ncbi:MAG: PD40 domain-containing protein [Candidatus Saganbacteria bacterium]|nr:PD40 domain-containing protein [Candidatus Saganbacteria bacterium]
MMVNFHLSGPSLYFNNNPERMPFEGMVSLFTKSVDLGINFSYSQKGGYRKTGLGIERRYQTGLRWRIVTYQNEHPTNNTESYALEAGYILPKEIVFGYLDLAVGHEFSVQASNPGPYLKLGWNYPIAFGPEYKKKKWSLIIDDQEAGLLGWVHDFWLSPDGKRMAYKFSRDGWKYMVIDGKKSQSYYDVEFLGFSPDSKRSAYVGRTKYSRDKLGHKIIQEVPILKALDAVGSMYSYRSSDHGKIITFKSSLIVDGRIMKKVPWFADKNGGKIKTTTTVNLKHFTYFLSPDGSNRAYIKKSGKKVFVAVNGKKSEKFDRVDKFTFSPNGKRFAYVANKKNTSYLIIDRKKTVLWGKVSSIIFSLDGKRIAYTLSQGTRNYIVIDGIISGPFESVDLPLFSPDGKRVAYKAKDFKEGSWVFIDGKKKGPYHRVSNYKFSPDSKKFAYTIFK